MTTAATDRRVWLITGATSGTARDAEVVDETVGRLGRIDVLVNNAGRTQVGALEETTDAEMRFLFELHYFDPAP